MSIEHPDEIADEGDGFESSERDSPEGRIERGETGVRLLITLLFFLIVQVVEAVLAVLILFSVGFALVTQTEPSEVVKRFTARVMDYVVEIIDYLSYNDPEHLGPPFPFRDLPSAHD